MGKPTGFQEFDRELPRKRSVSRRILDYRELYRRFPEAKARQQAARCLDCGVPTCHAGCPLGNLIPDFNDLVYRGQWRKALAELHATNNFPEFTGRLCPAPCEEACVLGIHYPAVTIEEIEKQIVERGFQEGWIQPQPPRVRTGKKVAVVGSGPAGLACAQQLNRAGHTVQVYERAEKIGGLLRYGIPDFKLEKEVIDRRLDILKAEGIEFYSGVDVGRDLNEAQLDAFDAIVLCIGSTRPRDLPIPGRDLPGVHRAMDFLTQQNHRVSQQTGHCKAPIVASHKNVIVIGGGDTGSDCVGTSHRQGAMSVTNFELLPQPSLERPAHQPWPYYPMRLRTSTSHEEGGARHWSILTKRFLEREGQLAGLETVEVAWKDRSMQEIPGSERVWPADLVLLALGFVGPETGTIVNQLGCELDPRGNIQTDSNYQTSVPHVFAAGDSRRGQSLIVWAISEGREAARSVDAYLTGDTQLPVKNGPELPRI